MAVLDNIELQQLINDLHVSVAQAYPYFRPLEWLQFLTGCRVEEASDANRWTLGAAPSCTLTQAKNGIVRSFSDMNVYEAASDLTNLQLVTSSRDYGRMWRYQLRRHLPRRYFRGRKEINTHLYRYNWVRNIATVAEGQAIFSNNLIWNTYYSAPITYN